MEENVVLLLGTNVGDKLDNLETAALELTSDLGDIVQQSAIYKTEPWGNKDQDVFLNQVIVIETSLRPIRIIEAIWDIEKRMGRKKITHWGPRIIDIDILFYGDLVYESDQLKIPHPMLHTRKFTLVPLCEIMPKYVHPLLLKSMQQLLSTCPDQSEVIAL